MADDLLAEMLRVGRRDRLVDLVLRHPVDAHRLARVADAAIPSTGDLHVGHVLIQLAVVRLAFVMGEHEWVLAMWRHDQLAVALEESVANNTQLGEHRAAEHHGVH